LIATTGGKKKEKRIATSGPASPGKKTPALLKRYQEEMVEHE